VPQQPFWFQAHLASYPVDTGALSPGIKWPGLEANCSPLCNAEVNLMCLHGMMLKFSTEKTLKQEFHTTNIE